MLLQFLQELWKVAPWGSLRGQVSGALLCLTDQPRRILPGMRQEALWRAAAFADAGADVLFIDALQSRDEMRAFCSAGGGASSVPKVGAAAS